MLAVLVGAGGLIYANKHIDALIMELAQDADEEELLAELKKNQPSPELNASDNKGGQVPLVGNQENSVAEQGKVKGQNSQASKQVASGSNKITPKVVYGVKIDTEDKARAVQIVTSKVPKSAINELLQLAKGGATPENKRKAKQILKRYLSAQDIKELKAIAARHAEGG